MAKPRKQYAREFKLEAVGLREIGGKSMSELERDLGITRGSLWRWKREFAADGGDAFPGRGRLTPEQEELRRLQYENAILRQERDPPRKAIAIPSPGSGQALSGRNP
jgi:transposase